MVHQDFERYAQEKKMNGIVSDQIKNILLKEKILNNNNIKILDSGCGEGKYYMFFKDYVKKENIYGVEVSKRRINMCHKNSFKNAILVEKGNKLPFKNNYFNLIISDQVIEHINKDDREEYLYQLKRVLKKDGILIIVTPNYPIKRIYDIKELIFNCKLSKIFDDSTHVTKYSFKSLRRLLKSYFRHVDMIATGGFIYKILNYEILSHKIIVVCRK